MDLYSGLEEWAANSSGTYSVYRVRPASEDGTASAGVEAAAATEEAAAAAAGEAAEAETDALGEEAEAGAAAAAEGGAIDAEATAPATEAPASISSTTSSPALFRFCFSAFGFFGCCGWDGLTGASFSTFQKM